MPIPIVVPQMGESVVEGTVGRWMKAEGDAIAKDETVAEIMTDKINVELPALESGTLGKILVEEGTVVPVGAEIGIILRDGESLPSGSNGGGGAAKASAPAKKEAPKVEAKPAPRPEPAKPAPSVDAGEKKSSPVVRRLLREYNLRLEDMPASGAGGRVTKQDVLSYIRDHQSAPGQPMATPTARPKAPVEPSAAYASTRTAQGEQPVERVPLAGVRKVIADHMIASKQTSAHVMTMDEVDLTELVKVRESKKDQWRDAVGANITYMPFILKSVIAALKEFPKVNASIEGNEIVYRKYYNIGIAVARDEGLIVPVVKYADQKSIAQIAREIADLGSRAHADKLQLDEITGSTFTLTNAGMFGALASTPVINQPEVAILGIHMIQKRPVVRNNEIVIRDMMYLTLSFDHRLIDGHTAVQFLRKVCERLEDPYELLLTVG